jgi:hypothetical protein
VALLPGLHRQRGAYAIRKMLAVAICSEQAHRSLLEWQRGTARGLAASHEEGQREMHDPDGYLIMIAHDLGQRPIVQDDTPT